MLFQARLTGGLPGDFRSVRLTVYLNHYKSCEKSDVFKMKEIAWDLEDVPLLCKRNICSFSHPSIYLCIPYLNGIVVVVVEKGFLCVLWSQSWN